MSACAVVSTIVLSLPVLPVGSFGCIVVTHRPPRRGRSPLKPSCFRRAHEVWPEGHPRAMHRRQWRHGTPEPSELAVEARSERDSRPSRHQPRKQQGRGAPAQAKAKAKMYRELETRAYRDCGLEPKS